MLLEFLSLYKTLEKKARYLVPLRRVINIHDIKIIVKV